MKVLEKGQGWSIEQRCTGKGNGDGGCNSLLLIEEDDFYTTFHTDLRGDKDCYYTFHCPVCGKETDIDESLIPTSIKRQKLVSTRTIHREWR